MNWLKTLFKKRKIIPRWKFFYGHSHAFSMAAILDLWAN